MSALKDQAAYFYTPSDVAKDHVPPGSAVRLGGMVEKGSLRRLPDGVTITFVVTDGGASLPVRFAGIVPALFREGSGVVADGKFDAGGQFLAETILAKHDERYMPPEIAKNLQGQAMHKSESLKK
jgi:cytochrome c-type biogenesis protein CcmE